MKRLFFYLALTFLYFQCFSNESSKDSCFSIRVKKIKFNEEKFKDNSSSYILTYNIIIEVKNVSDTIVSFHYNECSWQENFIIDNKSFYLRQIDCPTNRGLYLDLKPGESKDFDGLLVGRIELKLKVNKRFKIGFYLIEPSYNSHCGCKKDDWKFLEKKDDWKCIIWSKEYRIKTKRHKKK